jgi:hypothetical protein
MSQLELIVTLSRREFVMKTESIRKTNDTNDTNAKKMKLIKELTMKNVKNPTICCEEIIVVGG